jgi:N-acetyl-anhydromuramyl-L-alanine amidase AmpD
MPHNRKTVHQPRIDYDGRNLVDSHGSHRPTRIILHDTESHDTKGLTDLKGIAEFWDRQDEGFGAHVGVDAEGNSARYVNDEQIAWHTGGRNTGSLGIEMIGFASFSLLKWRRRKAQMEKVARWLAYWSSEYGIPLERNVEHGVSTHRAQSLAFRTSTHTDPGIFFPMRSVLKRARELKRTGWH